MIRIDRSGLTAFRRSLFTVSALAVLALSVLTAPLSAQEGSKPQGYPEDWSHHHLVFSNPGTYEQAVQDGTVDKWTKITNDPRYKIQQRARSRTAATSPDVASPASAAELAPIFRAPPPPLKKAAKLEKDWSTGLGGLAASLTGTVGSLSSGTISGSSTLDVAGTTLTASAPTGATSTGTFSGYPTSATAPTITANSGAGLITLTNNGSQQTETVQFTGPPLSSTSLTIPTTGSSTNSLVLTTSGAARQMVGSVGSTAPAANTTITITAGVSGSTTTTLTNGGTGATTTGTFSGPGYNTTAGQITVNNGTSTYTFSPGGTGASVVGTFANNLPWTGTMQIILNGGNNLVLTPSSGTLATGGAVVVSSTPTTGTIVLGNISYAVVTGGTVSAPGSAGNCNVTYTGSGSTARTNFRNNLAAAIATPASGSTSTYECNTATNTYISGATNNGSQVSLTLSSNYPGLAGQTAVNGTFSDSSNSTITNFSGGVNGTSGCTSSTAGTIATAPTSATQASDMISAITSCLASFPAVGVTATANGSSAVNVISVTPGASDDGFSLATTGTSAANFSFGAPANGTDAGSNTCSGTAGTYINSTTAATVGGNLASSMGACTSPGFTASGTGTVTVKSTAVGSTATLTVNATDPTNFNWTTNGTVNGSNGSSTCTGGTGTFAYSATAATLASNIAAALNSNSSACANALGVTVVQGNGSNGGTTTQVVVTENTPGTFTTLSGGGTVNTSAFSWAAASAGSNGTAAACGSATSGTFVTDSSTTNLAANLAAAINLCNTDFASKVLATANNNSSATVTITASVNGTFVLATATGSNATMLTIGSPTAGSNGTNTCTGSGPWTATFATSATLSTIEAGVTSAIVACPSGAGVTATGSAVVSSSVPGSGSSLTVGATGNTGIFTWSAVTPGTDGTNSSTTFTYWSVNSYLSSAQVATNIANAVNSNSTLQSVVSALDNVPASGNVTFTAVATGTAGNSFAVTPGSFSAFTGGSLSGGSAAPNGTVQPNAYPAKYSFDTTTASCANDFVVYPTGTATSTTHASIAAYNNIYSGCTGAVPSVFWTYSTGGEVSTSPVLSINGTQVAFIQESSGGVASLVLLKWAASTSESLTAQASGSAYQTCTAPCFYAMTFSGSHADTLSAPFYDYSGDVIYVGDDSGNLHQFTGVFNGAPAENTTSPWPVALGGTHQLASPVLDPAVPGVGPEVYVGDLGGVVYQVTPSTGIVKSAATVTGGQIADAPLIDSGVGYLIVFINSGTANLMYGYGEQFFPTSPGTVTVGTGATGYYFYAGAFDNVYFASGNRTGNIYVVGNTGATTAGATLYQAALSGGNLVGGAGLTAVASGLTGGTSAQHPWPSPVTEFCNGACALQTVTGCAVSGSPATTVTCSGGFTSADVGAWITGTNIPSGATIVSETGGTKVVISAAGTVGTVGTATIGVTAAGSTDYVFFSVNRGTPSGCSTTAGEGCILSYNVSGHSSASITASAVGSTITTPSTTGCWATSGIVIDNSATTPTGASEIYFVDLNGNAAGNPITATSSVCGGSVASTTIDGVQDSQASP